METLPRRGHLSALVAGGCIAETQLSAATRESSRVWRPGHRQLGQLNPSAPRRCARASRPAQRTRTAKKATGRLDVRNHDRRGGFAAELLELLDRLLAPPPDPPPPPP